MLCGIQDRGGPGGRSRSRLKKRTCQYGGPLFAGAFCDARVTKESRFSAELTACHKNFERYQHEPKQSVFDCGDLPEIVDAAERLADAALETIDSYGFESPLRWNQNKEISAAAQPATRFVAACDPLEGGSWATSDGSGRSRVIFRNEATGGGAAESQRVLNHHPPCVEIVPPCV